MSKREAYRVSKNRDVYRTLQLYYERGFNNEGKSIVILSEQEETIRVRWEAAFALMCNFHSPNQAGTKLRSTFDISAETAMRDVRNAIRLFGDVNRSNKEGKRYILFEYAMRCFQLAANSNPPQVDQMNTAVLNMIRISGVDKEDMEIPDYTADEIKQVIIRIHPSIVDKKPSKDLEAEIRKLLAPKKHKDFNIEDATIIDDRRKE